jgi:hypothetical protein
LLREIDPNVDQLMSVTVRRIESEVDDLLDRGLRKMFAGDTSPGHKLTVEKVYDLVRRSAWLSSSGSTRRQPDAVLSSASQVPTRLKTADFVTGPLSR